MSEMVFPKVTYDGIEFQVSLATERPERPGVYECTFPDTSAWSDEKKMASVRWHVGTVRKILDEERAGRGGQVGV